VTLNDGQDEAGYLVKEFLRIKGVKSVRDKLAIYIRDLKQEFSQGMILPKKESAAPLNADSVLPTSSQNGVKNKEKEILNRPVSSSDLECTGVGVKIKCKNLKDEEDFKCSISELYRALTDKDMVRAFTTQDAMIDATKGGRFSLFGGNVHGEFTELVADKKLVMRWRFKSWPAEHYSMVTMTLTQRDDGTLLSLAQTGIPVTEYEKTSEGWKNFYWRSIKQTFGYGACFF
jgi:activator of HSP90 ATPase